ncbi:MAG: phage tail protein [Alphaproteobacteria bacterium]|nr:MAG: phage tail protein [Alphaproteobacteria bacterium]
MASIILSAAGAALGAGLPGLGGAVAGPLLGAAGRAVGSMLDDMVMPRAPLRGPRLDHLPLHDSRYGAGLPIVYGRMRLPAQLIWAGPLRETLTTQRQGGKGGGGVSVRQARYSVSVALAVCLGQGARVETVWADGKVVYDGAWKSGMLASAAIYDGNAAQPPDPTMEGVEGAGNVPAYRGVCSIVLTDLNLGSFGNRLPSFSVEVSADPGVLAPQMTGSLAPSLYATPDTTAAVVACPPLPVAQRGSILDRVAIMGTDSTGNDHSFVVVEYDLTGDAPVEIARTISASVTVSSGIVRQSWSEARDGRYVLLARQHNDANRSLCLAIYDKTTRSFGPVLTQTMPQLLIPQIGWLDDQHAVIGDSDAGLRGARVYARAGMNVVSLGFFNVWGGSALRWPCDWAQFITVPGGLVALAGNAELGPSTITQRVLRWGNGALSVGSEQPVLSGLSGSPGNIYLLLPDDDQAILVRGYGNSVDLAGFNVTADGVAVTLSLTHLGVGGVASFNSFQYMRGRLIGLHAFASDEQASLSEIGLTASGFVILQSPILVTGWLTPQAYLVAYPVDGRRLLSLEINASTHGIERLGLVETYPSGQSLEFVVGDVLTRAGYAPSDHDLTALADDRVAGYVLDEPMTARDALEPLRLYRPFDLIESQGRLKAVRRHDLPDADIPSQDLRAASEGRAVPPAISTMRAQELDLPAEVIVDHRDPSRDYLTGSQRARRLAGLAHGTLKLSLPLVCQGSDAKRVAETRLFGLWAEREKLRLALGWKWLALDPGDVVTVEGRTLRLVSLTCGEGVMEAQAVPVAAALSSQALAESGPVPQRPLLAAPATRLELLDLPALRDGDDQAGLYVAATGTDSAWPGAVLMRSDDSLDWDQALPVSQASRMGWSVSALPPSPRADCVYPDSVGSVQVQMTRGELTSCTPDAWLAGANTGLLGDEIIQFQTATLSGPGCYTLSGLLRGRLGTESASSFHVPGERFVMLDSSLSFLPLTLNDRGRSLYWRGVSIGQDIETPPTVSLVPKMDMLIPRAPVHLRGTRAGVGADIALTWKRRARLSFGWMDGVDVPLDEPQELYDLEIMNGGNVMRVFSSLTTPSQTYTTAQQTADFGAAQASVLVRVYQISSRLGRGQMAMGWV